MRRRLGTDPTYPKQLMGSRARSVWGGGYRLFYSRGGDASLPHRGECELAHGFKSSGKSEVRESPRRPEEFGRERATQPRATEALNKVARPDPS